MENRPGSVKKRFGSAERIAAVDAIRSQIRDNSATLDNVPGGIPADSAAISRLQAPPTDGTIGVMEFTAIQFWFWYFSPPDRGAGGGA
jgi:hypothetical protein